MAADGSPTRKTFPSEAVCWATVLILAVAAFVLTHKDTLLLPFLSDDYPLAAMMNPPTAYKLLRSFLPERCDVVFYRPLSFLFFLMDSLLWGTHPLGFHLTNLLLHGTNACLVYLLARRLIRNRGGAVTAAVFFLLFPLQHEVVIWISGRADSLATLCYLLCALFYWQYRVGGRKRHLFGALLCGLLSLLSKENGLTFPVLLLGMEIILFGDKPAADRRRHLLCLMALLWILPLYVAFRWFSLRDTLPLFLASLPEHPSDLSAARLLVTSLAGVVASVFYYPWRPLACPLVQTAAWNDWVTPSYHACWLLLLLAGIATGALWNRVTRFCAALFFISLLPSGPMLPWIDRVHLQNARVLYLSIAFLSVLAGNLLFGGRETHLRILRPTARFAVVTALIALLCVGLYRNSRPWLDAARLSQEILTQFRAHALGMDHPDVIYVEGVPISHNGVYIFGTGFPEAVNLSMGTLPAFRIQPGKPKLSSYADFLLDQCPWRPIVPNFLAQVHLHAQLACQEYSFPDWYSEDPGDYVHAIRWNPGTETFEATR